MRYLLLAILCLAAGAGLGTAVTVRKMNLKYLEQRELSEKNYRTARMLNRWLLLYISGGNLAERMMDAGYRTVAIYGMNFAGVSLYRALKDSGIEVRYLIDRRAGKMNTELPVIRPEEFNGEADAVIVTAVYFFDQIKEELGGKTAGAIRSLDDFLKHN